VFDAELLGSAPRLKFIGHAAGSIKGFIFPEVFDRGIAVTHAAATIADSVGEWALTVTLAALRHVIEFDRSMRPLVPGTQPAASDPESRAGARPRGWGPEKGLIGFGNELYGKRVGIIAASMTGRAFIRLLAPFNCDVVVYDPYLTTERARELGVRQVDDLGELMATCDVVSNHAPTTPETRGMIGPRQIGLMKEGSYLLALSRGGIVDEPALIEALESGKLAGAGLDVTATEPLPPGDPLWHAPNLIITPHSSPASQLTTELVWSIFSENVGRFIRGEPLTNVVDKQRGY
jgi:phosphoglycerate dehydrogenase-like enzyme